MNNGPKLAPKSLVPGSHAIGLSIFAKLIGMSPDLCSLLSYEVMHACFLVFPGCASYEDVANFQ